MANLFNINTILFTFLGYQMSYLEFFGTILNLWCVWLVAKNKILNWPVGIAAVILFGILFYQIQLYSDFIEQIYFFITGFYGWWLWRKKSVKPGEKTNLLITHLSGRDAVFSIIVILAGTIAVGYFMSNIHRIFPAFFSVPASFPYLDAFTTVMSFTAQILMAYKKIESWYLWILVDAIGIGLYYSKEVVFISLLYAIFLIIAIKGCINWHKEYKNYAR